MIAVKSETVTAARISVIKWIFTRLHSNSERANGKKFQRFEALNWAGLNVTLVLSSHERRAHANRSRATTLRRTDCCAEHCIFYLKLGVYSAKTGGSINTPAAFLVDDEHLPVAIAAWPRRVCGHHRVNIFSQAQTPGALMYSLSRTC
jgi:hypothetical protein